jgi:uncharacterized membrane protein YkoI
MSRINKPILSFISGVIVATVFGITLTHAQTESDNGRYQVAVAATNGPQRLYEIVIDTKTGEIVSRTKSSKADYN